jgi:hypothetical protein
MRVLNVCFLAAVALSDAAMAVSPVAVTDNEESVFARGEFDGTVVTSEGELRLGRSVKVIMSSDTAPAALSALVAAGDAFYAAGGTDAAIYRLSGDKSEKFAQPPATVISKLLWTGKELLAATGGDEAGIYRIDAAGKHTALWTPGPDAQYVWAVVPDGAGNYYAATGSKAAVWRVDAAGKAERIYEAPKGIDNVLCLALAGDGLLYAGTDKQGLVIQIDPKSKTGRVILDADEDEVASVVPAPSGGVFAATADPSQAADQSSDEFGDEGGDEMDFDFGMLDLSLESKSAPPLLAEFEAAAKTRPARGKTAATKPAQSQPAPDDADAPAAAPDGPARSRSAIISGRSSRTSLRAMGAGSGGGNAVYHIGADGLARTIFRKPVVIHDMLISDGKLVLGTGNDGAVYSVTFDGREVTQLVNTDNKQVTALAASSPGAIALATANKGSVLLMLSGMAKEGTYTSPAVDASQIARWGTAQVQAVVPRGATLTLSTRTGNVAKPDDKTWAQWSKEVPVTDAYIPLASPAGRFMQYRVKFVAGPDGASPSVRQVETVHQVANLAPVIESVRVQSGGDSGPRMLSPMPRASRSLDIDIDGPRRSRSSDMGPVRRAPSPSMRSSSSSSEPTPMPSRDIEVAAEDENGDELTYTYYFREIGTEKWMQIADKLSESSYSWDTRTVGDGKYEVKVVVSDSLSNPPGAALETSKVSAVVVVDNTPPAVRDLAAKAQDKTVLVTGQAADAMSRLVSIHYSVDSAQEWTTVLPSDGMCDSDKESFSFQLPELAAGSHRVAVKVQDLYGNVGYGTLTVTTGGPASQPAK